MYIPIIYIYICICVYMYIILYPYTENLYVVPSQWNVCWLMLPQLYVCIYIYIYICIRLAVYVYMCIYICISYPSQILVWRAIKLLTSLHLVKCSGTPSCGASYTSFSWDSLGHHMGSSYSSKIWNSCGSFANYHLIIGRLPVIVY